MKQLSLALLALFSAVTLSACGEHQASNDTTEPATAQAPATLYAVKFHADWCGSCKAMAPMMKQARTEQSLDTQNVLFVTFDLTDDTTRYQAALQADAMGLSDLFDAHSQKTGYYLLVNNQTKEVVGKLTKQNSAEQMSGTIMAQIAAL